MAHVKVQRRSMRPEEYNSLRYGWLRRLIYENRRPVGPVMIRNARQTGENGFVFRVSRKNRTYCNNDGS